MTCAECGRKFRSGGTILTNFYAPLPTVNDKRGFKAYYDRVETCSPACFEKWILPRLIPHSEFYTVEFIQSQGT